MSIFSKNKNITRKYKEKRTDSIFQTLSRQLILDIADVHVTCIGYDMCEYEPNAEMQRM